MLRIHHGHGAPIWVSERQGGGIIVAAGNSRLLLSEKELPDFVTAISALTGIVADPSVARVGE